MGEQNIAKTKKHSSNTAAGHPSLYNNELATQELRKKENQFNFETVQETRV